MISDTLIVNGVEYQRVKQECEPENKCCKNVSTVKEFDWNNFPIGIVVEVRDSTLEEWKKRYFTRYNNECDYPYVAHEHASVYKHIVYNQHSWKYCKLTEQKSFTYWDGGECPFPAGVKLEVVFRCGLKDTITTEHDGLCWHHTNAGGDIIAYRVLGLADGWV